MPFIKMSVLYPSSSRCCCALRCQRQFIASFFISYFCCRHHNTQQQNEDQNLVRKTCEQQHEYSHHSRTLGDGGGNGNDPAAWRKSNHLTNERWNGTCSTQNRLTRLLPQWCTFRTELLFQNVIILLNTNHTLLGGGSAIPGTRWWWRPTNKSLCQTKERQKRQKLCWPQSVVGTSVDMEVFARTAGRHVCARICNHNKSKMEQKRGSSSSGRSLRNGSVRNGSTRNWSAPSSISRRKSAAWTMLQNSRGQQNPTTTKFEEGRGSRQQKQKNKKARKRFMIFFDVLNILPLFCALPTHSGSDLQSYLALLTIDFDTNFYVNTYCRLQLAIWSRFEIKWRDKNLGTGSTWFTYKWMKMAHFYSFEYSAYLEREEEKIKVKFGSFFHLMNYN